MQRYVNALTTAAAASDLIKDCTRQTWRRPFQKATHDDPIVYSSFFQHAALAEQQLTLMTASFKENTAAPWFTLLPAFPRSPSHCLYNNTRLMEPC